MAASAASKFLRFLSHLTDGQKAENVGVMSKLRRDVHFFLKVTDFEVAELGDLL